MQLLSTEEHNPPVRQPEYTFRRAVIIMSRKTRESPINYSPAAISPGSPRVSHLFLFTRGSWYAALRPSVQPKRALKMLSVLICSKRGKYSQHYFGSSFALPISLDSCSIHGKRGSSREEAWIRFLIIIQIPSVFHAGYKASLWKLPG